MKKKPRQQKPSSTIDYPKFDVHRHFSSSPQQIGLTSNQMASSGAISPVHHDLTPTQVRSLSTYESSKTQAFDNLQAELKRTWQDKDLPSSTASMPIPSSINDEDVETVNEVLGMEERSGKVYYKVNFTGHPPDYTAWVCEEDLIPE
jgi:hypothetical protein